MSFTSRVKIEDLINNGSILVHKDGNHGAKYPRTEEFGEVGVPFLTAKLLDSSGNIDLLNAPRLATEKAKKFTFGFVQSEDVLLSHNATVGRVAVMPQVAEPILIGTSLTHFRLDKSKILPTYLAAYFSGKDFQDQLAAVMSQTTRNQVPITSQRKLYIELPSIDIQTEIVKHIDSIDNKIRLNNQINQTLESIAQAIFKSWFVDFEPVRAKISAKQTGQDPELAAMYAISGKSEAELEQMAKEDFAELQATAALFPDELVDSELGEVPRGWSSVSIGSLIDLTIGGDWGKEVKDEKYKVQARVIRGTDIPSIKIGLDEQVPTRYIESKKLRTRELKLGDIVIEVSGGSPKQPTGRTIYISNEILLRLKDPVIPASFCRLLRPNSHELGVFLSIYLQKIYVEGKTWLYQNQSTGISNFQTTVFLEKEILTLPPLILLEEFEKIITPIIKKIDSSERLFLSNLRDTLLPKLLSGEMDMLGLQGEGA